MIVKINGEQPFQILADNFSISPSESSYVLQVSADGKEYSDLFSVGAGITRMITGVAAGSFYRLKNNTSEVSVNWRKSCGGGSEGGATELKPMESLPMTADEGAVAATVEGVFQFNDGTWNPIGGSDEELAQRVDEIEETTSIALNDLNDRVGNSFIIKSNPHTGELDATGFWDAFDASKDKANFKVYVDYSANGFYNRCLASGLGIVGRDCNFELVYGDGSSSYHINENEEIEEGSTQTVMTDGSVYRMVAMSQADYDAASEEGIIDDNVLYIITD